MDQHHSTERNVRHSVRIPLHGVARVKRSSGETCTCNLRNLSLGGALLRGVAPPLGERVEVSLEILDRPDIEVSGRVVRATCGQGSFALAFSDLTADVEDAIHDLSLRLLERDRDLAVLVVHRLAQVRSALAARLAAAGWRVIEATSPLHALALLERSAAEIQWVVVGGELTQTSGLDLIEHVASAYPRVGRVLVASPHAGAPLPHARTRHAAAVLNEPVARGALEATVGVSPGSALRRP